MGRARIPEVVKQQRKVEDNRKRNLTRICLGSNYERWVSQRDRTGTNNFDFIRHLLDVHDIFCLCSKRTGTAAAEEVCKLNQTNEDSSKSEDQTGQQNRNVPSPGIRHWSEASLLSARETSQAPCTADKQDNLTDCPAKEIQSATADSAQDIDANPNGKNTATSSESQHVNDSSSWKFVHFPTSWKYGDRLAVELAFSHYPSMTLMARGMTRSLATDPPGEGPDTERPLSMSNFLELYFTAKMMERRSVSVKTSGGAPCATMYNILQKWMSSFFGIKTTDPEIRLKTERVIRQFQSLESKYNHHLNERNFEKLGDFLLLSWSSFWSQDSNKLLKFNAGSDLSQMSEDAPRNTEEGDLDFRVYRNEEEFTEETDSADEVGLELKKEPLTGDQDTVSATQYTLTSSSSKELLRLAQNTIAKDSSSGSCLISICDTPIEIKQEPLEEVGQGHACQSHGRELYRNTGQVTIHRECLPLEKKDLDSRGRSNYVEKSKVVQENHPGCSQNEPSSESSQDLIGGHSENPGKRKHSTDFQSDAEDNGEGLKPPPDKQPHVT